MRKTIQFNQTPEEYFESALQLLKNHEESVSSSEKELRMLFAKGIFNKAIEDKNVLNAIKEAASDISGKGAIFNGKKLTPMGRGSSHKIAFKIEGDNTNCFVAIPKSKAKDLANELKLYDLLAHAGVRIPKILTGLEPITFEEEPWVGVVMEKMVGTEYKQTLSWMFVKKQIAKWNNDKGKIENLLATIETFIKSGAFVTDLQVFILDTTGEMVVFDPSTVSLIEKPLNTELKNIQKGLIRMLQDIS